HRDDKDAAPAPAADELREQNAGFQRLAETDCVGNQDARPRLLEREPGGMELKVHHVEHRAAPEHRLARRRGHAPELALQVEPRAPVPGSWIHHELRLAGIEYRDLRLVLLEEDRLLVAHDLGYPHDVPGSTSAARLVHLGD